MSRHNHRCDDCMDVITSILTDCKAQYLTSETMAQIIKICNPCQHCQEEYSIRQSRLTGRIYLVALVALRDDLQNSGCSILDMFDKRNKWTAE